MRNDHRREGGAVLELDRLSKRYGEVVALDDLSLTVRPGQMYGFVGTNGAGKTTAMRIVLGVLDADAGEVRWQGHRLGRDGRREFGYMPEERGLYPKMRLLEQLVFLAELRGTSTAAATRSALALLERFGLAERARDRVEQLSLGNQQRIQLAAALVHDPTVLVLDEPFSGLDPVGVDAMATVLRERVDAGAALVFSSHQLDLVERLCDAVGIIREGRLVADGTVAELRGVTGSRRYRVLVEAGADWPDRLVAAVPGATVLDHGQDGGSALFELPADSDDQLLLAAAQRLGAVHQFGTAEPTLVELFREVVSDEPVPADAEAAA
jgi:ABC-2 type transport system ATP-binding protein